jgi:hypothetical protein
MIEYSDTCYKTCMIYVPYIHKYVWYMYPTCIICGIWYMHGNTIRTMHYHIFIHTRMYIYICIYIYVSYNRVLTKNMSHALSHESLNIDFDPGPRDWVESPLTRIVFHTNYRMDTQWNHGPYVSISSQYSRKKTVFRNLSIATYLVNIPIYSHLPSGNQRWHFWKSMGSSHLWHRAPWGYPTPKSSHRMSSTGSYRNAQRPHEDPTGWRDRSGTAWRCEVWLVFWRLFVGISNTSPIKAVETSIFYGKLLCSP